MTYLHIRGSLIMPSVSYVKIRRVCAYSKDDVTHSIQCVALLENFRANDIDPSVQWNEASRGVWQYIEIYVDRPRR